MQLSTRCVTSLTQRHRSWREETLTVELIQNLVKILPAKARDQQTHNEGAQQTSNREDRHNERVQEG